MYQFKTSLKLILGHKRAKNKPLIMFADCGVYDSVSEIAQ